jgi:hypothetical protein
MMKETKEMLAEVSYLVNCRPMQPNPAMGEDSFICPHDIIMADQTSLPHLRKFLTTI